MGKHPVTIELLSGIVTSLDGGVASGAVSVHYESRHRARAVRIELTGVSHATIHYRTHSNGKTHAHGFVCRDDQMLGSRCREAVLWAPAADVDGKLDQHLEAGLYRFPFQLQIPGEALPSWSRGSWRVEYLVTATVEIPWGRDDRCTVPVTYLCFADPTHRVPTPCILTTSKHFLFGGPKPLSMAMALADRIFVPGQALSFRLSISNPTTKSVRAIKASLHEIASCAASGRSQTIDLEIREQLLWTEKIPENSDFSEVLSFDVPPGLSPTFNRKHLRVRYELRISLDVRFASDPAVVVDAPMVLLPCIPAVALAAVPYVAMPVPGSADMPAPFGVYVVSDAPPSAENGVNVELANGLTSEIEAAVRLQAMGRGFLQRRRLYGDMYGSSSNNQENAATSRA